MPTIEQNRGAWNAWDWSQGGEEWSKHWGGSLNQWHWFLLPRLAPFLPAGDVLELAPGAGRFSQHLLPYCDQLTLVDISKTGLEACRKRLGKKPNVAFHVNDGSSLPMVPDKSIDFAFSFDSLVHAEMDAVGPYLKELARVLRPGAVAWIHHANLSGDQELEPSDASHGRARGVTAETVAEASHEAGLSCIGQEIVAWGGKAPIDCISVFVNRPPKADARPTVVNPGPAALSPMARHWAHVFAAATAR